MKQTKTKILIALIVIILIAGTVMIFTKGLAFELKYQDSQKVELNIGNIAHIRGRDIIKPYIIPFAIATVIILVYLAIRYYKLNSFKILLQSVGIIVLAQAVLLGIIAITRMGIGEVTIPAILVVYVLSTYICTRKFDTDLENKLTEENKTVTEK